MVFGRKTGQTSTPLSRIRPSSLCPSKPLPSLWATTTSQSSTKTTLYGTCRHLVEYVYKSDRERSLFRRRITTLAH
jgi:hypothetical protein